MISIVVCSIRPDMLAALTENIERTIGVEYELIAMDNRNTGLGICRVYNEGAERARYEILCFMHEDVEFLEAGWGRRVVEHFSSDGELGVIGLAGACIKSRAPSGWMAGGRDRYNRIHIHQRHRDGRVRAFHYGPKGDVSRSRVCTLDGVWICARRQVWQELRFNEALAAFHFYDVDFALRACQKYAVAVVYDVELVHFSEGSFDARWMEEALNYQALVSVSLPVAVAGFPAKELARQEWLGVRFWLKFLRKVKAPLSLRWRWVRAGRALRYPRLWGLVLKFMFYYPLKFR